MKLALILFAIALPATASAQSSQTYCQTDSGHTTCTTYGSDGSAKQTYCQDSFGKTVSCNSYSSDGSTRQTNCHDSFGNGVNCTSYGSDGTVKQTDCHDGFGNTVNCTTQGSDGSITQTNCRDSFGNTVVCSSYGSGGSTSQTQITGPVCDAGCQQQQAAAQQQQYFEAGQRLGQGVGLLVGTLVERHRMKSFCKKNPSGYWRFANGSVLSCSGGPVVSQDELDWANTAKPLMDELRDSSVQMASFKSDNSAVRDSLDQSRDSWLRMRDMYCKGYPRGSYVDLDGNQQVCGQ
jgi:hypothetical protein